MTKYISYFLFYSIGGWLLERLINIIFLGYWYDNSVLFGPYQALYGLPLVLVIVLYDKNISKIKNKQVKELLLLATAILFTALSEGLTGISYEWLTGNILWDYSMTFRCHYPYVCLFPTTLFGILSYIVIRFGHPIFKKGLAHIPVFLIYTIFTLYMIDFIITLTILV